MSEMPINSDQGPPLAEVIDITKRQRPDDEGMLNPSELTNEEAIDLFFSQLRHPAMKTKPSSEIGEFILLQIGGHPISDMSAVQIAWRSRAMEMLVDVDDINEAQLDTWLDEDVPLATLYDAIRATKVRAQEMPRERAAMRELRHLRGGMLHREETTPENDQEWLALIAKLRGSVVS